MKTAFAPIFSHLYRKSRTRTIRRVYEQQHRERRPRDLEAVVEIGDQRLKALPAWLYTFPIPPGIGVDFYDLYFPSPLTLAAFKDDLSIIDIWMRLGLGGACIKTVMKEPRAGNKRPRLQEVKTRTPPGLFGGYVEFDGLINAMGLPGHGVEGKIQEFEQSALLSHGRPIGLSIGGSSIEEYRHVFDRLHEYIQGKNVPYYFEVNVSCPNTPEGQQMTKNPQLLEDLLKYMRERTNVVMGAKFSPDTPDKQLLEFAEMLKRFQRTYMNLGNTTFRKCADVGLPDNAISTGGGGLSGPALFGRTLEMTRLIAPTGIAICATGGVDSAEKVRALQDSVKFYNIPLIVGMATAVVKDMYCIQRINRELARKS